MSENSNNNSQPERFNEGQQGAHLANDSKDERSIANRLAAETKKNEEPSEVPEAELSKIDPLLPAKIHGNKPSRGAEIDAEIAAEEQEYLERKGKA